MIFKNKRLESEIKNHISMEHKNSGLSFNNVKQKCNLRETSHKEEMLVLSNGQLASTRRSVSFKLLIPVLIIALACIAIMLLPQKNDTNGGYFLIDVNPSIELRYNKDGKVIDSTPLNEDAEIVLFDLDLKDMSYEDAIDLIVNKLVELEYLVEGETNAILTTAVDNNGKKDKKMTEKVKDVFESTLKKNEIKGDVLIGVVNEELIKEAEQYGIDAQKLELIKQFEAIGGELDTEEYDDITIRNLYHMISKQEKEIAKEEKKALKEEIKSTRNELHEAINSFCTFAATIVVDEELKAELDALAKEISEDEYDDKRALDIIAKMELGGYEEYLDELLAFKNDISSKQQALEDMKCKDKENDKTVEEKHNDRLENIGNKENNGNKEEKPNEKDNGNNGNHLGNEEKPNDKDNGNNGNHFGNEENPNDKDNGNNGNHFGNEEKPSKENNGNHYINNKESDYSQDIIDGE